MSKPRVDRNYENCCAEAEYIRVNMKNDGGDRVFMLGKWLYPSGLYRHLMTCHECERRGHASESEMVTITLSPSEVVLLIEALEEVSSPDDRRRPDAAKDAKCNELCNRMRANLPVPDLTSEHQI